MASSSDPPDEQARQDDTKAKVMSGRLVHDSWEDFRKMVIHQDVGQVQLEESRKCFYGGFTAAMAIFDAVSELDNLTEEEAGRTMETLWSELMFFAKGLRDNGTGGLSDQELKIKH